MRLRHLCVEPEVLAVGGEFKILQGFSIVAAFDANPQLVGGTIEGIPIHAMDQLEQIAREKGIKLAILAVPAEAAQQVASSVVAAGIDGILNFAPVTLSLPDQVSSVGVDLAIELEQLSFAVVSRGQKP